MEAAVCNTMQSSHLICFCAELKLSSSSHSFPVLFISVQQFLLKWSLYAHYTSLFFFPHLSAAVWSWHTYMLCNLDVGAPLSIIWYILNWIQIASLRKKIVRRLNFVLVHLSVLLSLGACHTATFTTSGAVTYLLWTLNPFGWSLTTEAGCEPSELLLDLSVA